MFSKDSFATLPLAYVELTLQIKGVKNSGRNGIFDNEAKLATYGARK
ncbi:MAG TPA: hypothetical protein VE548_01540 [Nitrososphaeraceae archaeon]|nr:hypothetical protein [Nitrososphaeraceae archaeon]